MGAQFLLAGAAGLLSAAGEYQQGLAAESAGKYNALVAEQNAENAIWRSAEEERRFRVQGRKILGDMRTGYAAGGVTLEGSPLDALEESAANIERDALMIKFEGQLTAAGYRNEAALERSNASNAKKGAFLNAAGSLLSGGSRAYSMKGK